MAELKDKELNEVNGGSISDPLLPGVDIPDDLSSNNLQSSGDTHNHWPMSS